MAENDIYNNQKKYDGYVERLKEFVHKPKIGSLKAKYYCKNKTNLSYFQILFSHFDAKDISYARRNRLIGTLRLICHATLKNLKDCDRNASCDTFNLGKREKRFVARFHIMKVHRFGHF